jgi:hypothetical protein
LAQVLHHRHPVLEQYDFTSDNVRCMNFTLTDVNWSMSFDAYYGTASLQLRGMPVPVQIIRAQISKQGGTDTMTYGSVFIGQPAELPDIGLTLVSLDISPHENHASVSGYIKSTAPGKNLAGDLYALKFEGAKLLPGVISISKDLPEIRYKQLKIYNIKNIKIDLALCKTRQGLLLLQEPDVTKKYHLENAEQRRLNSIRYLIHHLDSMYKAG